MALRASRQAASRSASARPSRRSACAPRRLVRPVLHRRQQRHRRVDLLDRALAPLGELTSRRRLRREIRARRSAATAPRAARRAACRSRARTPGRPRTCRSSARRLRAGRRRSSSTWRARKSSVQPQPSPWLRTKPCASTTVCGVPSGSTRTSSPSSGAVLPKPRSVRIARHLAFGMHARRDAADDLQHHRVADRSGRVATARPRGGGFPASGGQFEVGHAATSARNRISPSVDRQRPARRAARDASPRRSASTANASVR